ncbi:MAG: hypothetical protein JKX74_05505 [Flavobacteriales bacterium]|nr:hypothetical protein [Flavobacteriales bacterium]
MGDKLEDFIKSNQEDFDLSEPRDGHLERFEAQLSSIEKRDAFSWRNLLKIAAVVIFVLGSGVLLVNDDSSTVNASTGLDLKDISPELAEVASFYTDQIENATEELTPMKSIDKLEDSENLKQQLELLEVDYKQLKIELKDNYADERLINSMIKNYQLRLQIIEQYMNQIKFNNAKNLKDNENVKY